MIQQLAEGPVLADWMIAREPEARPRAHDPSELLQRLALDEAALCVPAFRPGIRKQQEYLPDRGWRQGIQQETGIVREDARAGTVLYRQPGEKGRYPVDERFTSEESHVRVGLRLRGQVFAAPEPDFEPGFGGGDGKEGRWVERSGCAINVDRELGQDVFDQRLPAGAQLPAGPASVAAVAGRLSRWRHEGRRRGRSVPS